MIDALPEARETGEARFELGVLEAAQGRGAAACQLAKELQQHDERRLVAKCAVLFCATVASSKPDADACASLNVRADDDRRGVARAVLER